MKRVPRTLILAVWAGTVFAQNAQLSGLIQDPSLLKVAGAEITVRNEQTGGKRISISNDAGLYSVFSLSPGVYRVSVRAPGFESIVRDSIKLDVGENARLDFDLRIGDSRIEVTVHGGPPLMNVEDASIGTVIDRNIIDEMPLNGRGIQTLIELTPGVVVVPVVDASRGQFSVNGQRSDANYFTVDGVSANFGAGNALAIGKPGSRYSLGQAGGGMLPANNFLGTFTNLVSPDALQEFKIQTSTFAPEYGRSPGAQIGLITRSGGNRLSGSLFEYIRNDKTDGNDWFANSQAVPRPPLRLNNFGGTLGGPVAIPHVYDGHDRTFFFLSVEDLLLTQSFFVAIPVPTLQTRQKASAAFAPLLNVFPLPNQSSNPYGDPAVTGLAQFARSYSVRQGQQTYGLRIDHSFTDRFLSFMRYNKAPSRTVGPAETISNPANIQSRALGTEMLTVGFTHVPSPNLVNEIRLNGSRQSAQVDADVQQIAGAGSVADSLLFPAGYSSSDSAVGFSISSLPAISIGLISRERARQLQAVDNLSWSRGAHRLKVGVDYRWFSPVHTVPRLTSIFFFSDLSAATVTSLIAATNNRQVAYVAKAFSAYVQDTWTARRTLTLTFGARWELNPAPHVSVGQAFIADITDLNDISTVHPISAGKPSYPTSWLNFAPRLGLAWQISETAAAKTVLRAGAGSFFDLAQSGFQDLGAFNALLSASLEPFVSLPITPSQNQLLPTPHSVVAAAPGYKLPVTYQWNVTIEQLIGQQTFSAGYVGALGRRLIGYAMLPDPGPYSSVIVLGNNARSSYQAMQLQFNRRLSSRVRLLLSYSWSHSIDNLSNDFNFGVTRTLTKYLNPNVERGSSDFDIRHSLNGSLMAALPSPGGRFAAMLFSNWSANSIFFARSALPTDLHNANTSDPARPNLVPGQPLYLYGAQYPGGKRYNDAAFSAAPSGADGNLGRNVLRGFGAWQIDFALHRTFRLSEQASLQFRAEAFNILNHPNFANPADAGTPSSLTLSHNPDFGRSTQTLASGLSSTGVAGQLNPLFQIGGPRTMQFALRLTF